MKVLQMKHPITNTPVANQYIITNSRGKQIFQSYNDTVAIKSGDNVYTSEGLYNVSYTTEKYFRIFSRNFAIRIIPKEDFIKLINEF